MQRLTRSGASRSPQSAIRSPLQPASEQPARALAEWRLSLLLTRLMMLAGAREAVRSARRQIVSDRQGRQMADRQQADRGNGWLCTSRRAERRKRALAAVARRADRAFYNGASARSVCVCRAGAWQGSAGKAIISLGAGLVQQQGRSTTSGQ